MTVSTSEDLRPTEDGKLHGRVHGVLRRDAGDAQHRLLRPPQHQRGPALQPRGRPRQGREERDEPQDQDHDCLLR